MNFRLPLQLLFLFTATVSQAAWKPIPKAQQNDYRDALIESMKGLPFNESGCLLNDFSRLMKDSDGNIYLTTQMDASSAYIEDSGQPLFKFVRTVTVSGTVQTQTLTFKTTADYQHVAEAQFTIDDSYTQRKNFGKDLRTPDWKVVTVPIHYTPIKCNFTNPGSAQ
jgi:hypothetical protein